MSNTQEVVAAISDPGEVGRADHNRGDRIIVAISNVAAWLFPILMLAISAQVVLRAAGHNQAWLDDAQWWMYGMAVLIGIAYAVTTNSHVRVDIFYDNFERRKRIIVDIIGIAWLFLPFIILCWDVTLDYAISSIKADEGSDSPNGLHNLWLLKTFMNLSFIVIAFALWSAYLRLMRQLGETRLWKILLWAFPTVAFVIDLAAYYLTLGVLVLGAAEGTTTREITRSAVFQPLELGETEISPMVVVALVLTVAMIVLARLFARKDA
ncbi:TRAP transporter small permease subunit [Salipiger sp.]|uniref:TRAP transporter small permease subunit n=1 Tax=Salipiger sp. TaxID=2078585 RepID=UPI003A968CFB